MTDLVALFNEGSALFGTRVHRVSPEQWSAGTPCRDWSVADLVDHLIDEHLWMPPLLSGHDLPTAGSIVESQKRTLGDDRPAAWDAAALASGRAISEPGALERQVALSRGPTPATDYLREMIFDLAVHGWDLGRAIGADDALPDDLVQFAMPMADAFNGMEGFFDPSVPAPEDASDEERMIARTGRNPR